MNALLEMGVVKTFAKTLLEVFPALVGMCYFNII